MRHGRNKGILKKEAQTHGYAHRNGVERYRIGDSYYRAEIMSREYLADGRLAVKIMIDHPAPGNLTISEIQLYDTNNNLWLKKPENIMREDVTAGILYRFTFDFHEN